MVIANMRQARADGRAQCEPASMCRQGGVLRWPQRAKRSSAWRLPRVAGAEWLAGEVGRGEEGRNHSQTY